MYNEWLHYTYSRNVPLPRVPAVATFFAGAVRATPGDADTSLCGMIDYYFVEATNNHFAPQSSSICHEVRFQSRFCRLHDGLCHGKEGMPCLQCGRHYL
jgi:hypothetical protein